MIKSEPIVRVIVRAVSGDGGFVILEAMMVNDTGQSRRELIKVKAGQSISFNYEIAERPVEVTDVTAALLKSISHKPPSI